MHLLLFSSKVIEKGLSCLFMLPNLQTFLKIRFEFKEDLDFGMGAKEPAFPDIPQLKCPVKESSNILVFTQSHGRYNNSDFQCTDK